MWLLMNGTFRTVNVCVLIEQNYEWEKLSSLENKDQQRGNSGRKMMGIDWVKEICYQHLRGFEKGVASEAHLCIYVYG